MCNTSELAAETCHDKLSFWRRFLPYNFLGCASAVGTAPPIVYFLKSKFAETIDCLL